MMKHAVCVNVEKKNPTMSIAITKSQVNVGAYALFQPFPKGIMVTSLSVTMTH